MRSCAITPRTCHLCDGHRDEVADSLSLWAGLTAAELVKHPQFQSSDFASRSWQRLHQFQPSAASKLHNQLSHRLARAHQLSPATLAARKLAAGCHLVGDAILLQGDDEVHLIQYMAHLPRCDRIDDQVEFPSISFNNLVLPWCIPQ
jgi:hypothetical protein